MYNSLLSYFEQELRTLKDEGAIFAEKHPNVASRVGLSDDVITDPQIKQLIESVAFLNGGLRKKLDETFPEFTESLINIIYPHFLKITPSCSLLEFKIEDSFNTTHSIPKNTEFDISVPDSDDVAIFRTTENVDIYPITLTDVSSAYAPFEFESSSKSESAKAMVELTFNTLDDGLNFSDIKMEMLRLYLHGRSHFALRVNDALSQPVSLELSFNGQTIHLNNEDFEPLPFSRSESLIDNGKVNFAGFNAISEFFTFSEKFNGYQVRLASHLKGVASNEFKLRIFLSELPVDISRSISAENFKLYCTPIINLHKMTSDPFSVDFLKRKYPISVNSARGGQSEVFSVEEIRDITDEEALIVPEVFRDKFKKERTGLRWQLQQKYLESGVLGSYLKVFDTDGDSSLNGKRIFTALVTATEGELAQRVTSSSNIKCRESITIPAILNLLRLPTMPIEKPENTESHWALLSHLLFNYKSLFGSQTPLKELVNLFVLYNKSNDLQNMAFIDSIYDLQVEQVVSPIRVSGKNCFAYGNKVTVVIDPNVLSGGIALFSHFLDSFFGFYAGINSFSQVNIKLRGKTGFYREFPRRAGCKKAR